MKYTICLIQEFFLHTLLNEFYFTLKYIFAVQPKGKSINKLKIKEFPYKPLYNSIGP